jgi:hypothetical protein
MKTTGVQTADERHKTLLRRFHATCHRLGLDEDTRRAMVKSLGKESSKELTVQELEGLCTKLSESKTPGWRHNEELDTWRKRVLAAGCAWRRAMGQPEDGNDIRYVKAVACRMDNTDKSGKHGFNAIGETKLRDIYNAFINKRKALEILAAEMAETNDKAPF